MKTTTYLHHSLHTWTGINRFTRTFYGLAATAGEICRNEERLYSSDSTQAEFESELKAHAVNLIRYAVLCAHENGIELPEDLFNYRQKVRAHYDFPEMINEKCGKILKLRRLCLPEGTNMMYNVSRMQVKRLLIDVISLTSGYLKQYNMSLMDLLEADVRREIG